ncbi:hypothetical protein SLE2022_012790 [Rubroshorea leprosula]
MLDGYPKSGYSSPFLLSLKVQVVGKLNPIDVNRLAFHMLSCAGVQKIWSQKKNVIEEHDAETKSTTKSMVIINMEVAIAIPLTKMVLPPDTPAQPPKFL